jgi:hypothetical protein
MPVDDLDVIHEPHDCRSIVHSLNCNN